jgi:hypothetical protein
MYEMLYLVTFWDDEIKQRIAFLVQADSRAQARRIVTRYCIDNYLFGGLKDRPFMRSHLLVVDNEHLLQRIDDLVV